VPERRGEHDTFTSDHHPHLLPPRPDRVDGEHGGGRHRRVQRLPRIATQRARLRSHDPRAVRPLYDATAQLIARAAGRAEERRALGRPAEDIVFVTFTDGEENSSVRYTRRDVLTMVKAHEEQGWTFVFLGAGLDAYAEGGAIGHAPGSTQAFAPDGRGARLAYASLDQAMSRHRRSSEAARAAAKAVFFEATGKDAEDDRRERY
jgi:hypothetical protein